MPNDWRWIGGEYSATETLDNGLPDLFGELPFLGKSLLLQGWTKQGAERSRVPSVSLR